MANYTMEYSEERGTWNVIDLDYNEWIYEGDFDTCCEMVNRANAYDDDEDYGYSNEYDY